MAAVQPRSASISVAAGISVLRGVGALRTARLADLPRTLLADPAELTITDNCGPHLARFHGINLLRNRIPILGPST